MSPCNHAVLLINGRWNVESDSMYFRTFHISAVFPFFWQCGSCAPRNAFTCRDFGTCVMSGDFQNLLTILKKVQEGLVSATATFHLFKHSSTWSCSGVFPNLTSQSCCRCKSMSYAICCFLGLLFVNSMQRWDGLVGKKFMFYWN